MSMIGAYVKTNYMHTLKIPTLLFFIASIFTSATFVQKQFAYQIECVSVDNSGAVAVKIWNPNKGKNYSQLQARKDAIHAILFSGIPSNNGCIPQKPLLTTSESIEAFKNIEQEFFDKKGIWSKYSRTAIISSTLPEIVGDKSWKVYQVSISKDLLRKYLEEQKIIKSLNSGF